MRHREREARAFEDARDHAMIRVLTEGVRRAELVQIRVDDLPADLIPGQATAAEDAQEISACPRRPHATLNAMTPNGAFTGPPGNGWQQRTLPALAQLAAQDARISDFRVHGSASGAGAAIDRWSDLDVLITAAEPSTAAEDLAREIGRRLSPVYAADRGGDPSAYTVRLVLSDLRRIDITATAPAGGEQRSAAAAQNQSPSDPIAELIGAFQFEAVLAAVKVARHDVLIGAHLTLQLARHILVIAMLLRDRDAGTAHHRYGGSRWDVWASHLGEVPAPYTQAAITAAIRFYTIKLDKIVAEWDSQLQLDNRPLLELLDAVDQESTP
jgi:hypothetical protein